MIRVEAADCFTRFFESHDSEIVFNPPLAYPFSVHDGTRTRLHQSPVVYGQSFQELQVKWQGGAVERTQLENETWRVSRF